MNMVLPTMAKDEAPVLARSLHGRQVTHVAADGEEEGADDTRFVVAGHSYGNIVAGVTAGEYGLAADAWAIGGVGWVRLRKAADADVPDVHATLAENDPLQKVAKVSKWAGQGPQPATDEFEANGIFASGPGPRGKLLGGTSMDAHYGYPKDSLFQHNVGAIFLGQPPTYTVPVYDAA